MKALVCGAGGFIGSHLVKRLHEQGYYVVGIDLKQPEYWKTFADEFYELDLRHKVTFESAFYDHRDIDEIYQLAADMGGLGYIATGLNDFEIMTNNFLINLNCARSIQELVTGELTFKIPKLFFSSSSCVYPRKNQMDPNAIVINEESAYPADCDNNYGWEKLFTERLYEQLHEKFNVDIRIARFHNCYGPYETYTGNRTKAPAASCVKVTQSKDGKVEVWGPGNQIRTFMYIDDCIDGIKRLMNHPEYIGPVNLGSEEKVTANELVQITAAIAGKEIEIVNVDNDPLRPTGVPFRTSDNRKLVKHLGWSPNTPLVHGMTIMYEWIKEQLDETGLKKNKTS
jgi:nucleoside-diphosphate-sugar epimerase